MMFNIDWNPTEWQAENPNYLCSIVLDTEGENPSFVWTVTYGGDHKRYSEFSGKVDTFEEAKARVQEAVFINEKWVQGEYLK